MIIKTFTAPSMIEAMALIREELGENAVILSSQKTAEGNRITAALEEDGEENKELNPSESIGESFFLKKTLTKDEEKILRSITEAVDFHKLSAELKKKIEEQASLNIEKTTLKTFETALENVFNFAKLPNTKLPKVFMLLGAHGAGKTMAVAKLATKMRMEKFAVGIISTDFVKPGAISELESIAKILNTPFAKAKTYMDLSDKLALLKESCDFIYIDTPGVNPLDKNSMAGVANLSITPDITKILVTEAGLDVDDAIEAVAAFQAYTSPEFILPTKIDVARRLGSVLAQAYTANLKFCDISLRSSLVRSICPITPLSLARLMLPEEFHSQEE